MISVMWIKTILAYSTVSDADKIYFNNSIFKKLPPNVVENFPDIFISSACSQEIY